MKIIIREEGEMEKNLLKNCFLGRVGNRGIVNTPGVEGV